MIDEQGPLLCYPGPESLSFLARDDGSGRVKGKRAKLNGHCSTRQQVVIPGRIRYAE